MLGVGDPLCGPAGDVRAGGSRASACTRPATRPCPAGAPDPVGARARAPARRAADRRAAGAFDRPGERPRRARRPDAEGIGHGRRDRLQRTARRARDQPRRPRAPRHARWKRPTAARKRLGRPLRRTEDAREAQRAFVEKRRPLWKGKLKSGGPPRRPRRRVRSQAARSQLRSDRRPAADLLHPRTARPAALRERGRASGRGSRTRTATSCPSTTIQLYASR